MRLKNEDGQALLELTLGGALLILSLTGATWLLRIEWRRLQCAHLVFEATRGALRGEPPPRASPDVRIRITARDEGVTGDGKCGDLQERVGLRRLEHATL
jgi:hypothetical protein